MKWQFLCLILCILSFVQLHCQEDVNVTVTGIIQGIIGLLQEAADTEFKETSVQPLQTVPFTLREYYDFIIVGSGPAGCALASRLTENPNCTVLLLEAGEEESDVGQIPSVTNLLALTRYNWGYRSEPQKYSCQGMVNQQCTMSLGKILGGYSGICNELYIRGNKADFNRWSSKDLGQWSYDDMLPYFKKLEDFNIINYDPKYHSKGGPVNVEDLQYSSTLGQTFLDAATELGNKIVEYNGEEQIGFRVPEVYTKQGKRQSMHSAYIVPVIDRENLQVLTSSHVTKILIDNKKAEGVEFFRNNTLHRAIARKEIILSTGSINSAQLLVLSGIGPNEQLQKFQIPKVVNLPVGRNLRDQMMYPGLLFTVDGDPLANDSILDSNNIQNWYLNGKGPLAKTADIEGLGFIRTQVSEDEPEGLPDIALVLIVLKIDSTAGLLLKKSFGITDDIYNNVWKPIEGKTYMSVLPILVRPKSTGEVTLKSTDPFAWPKIDPNYLSNSKDVDSLVEAIKYVFQLADTEAFKKVGATFNKHRLPACDKYNNFDQYWRCAIRQLARPLSVPVGTCKMGSKTDNAVVDEQLKVFGVDGLRVIDNSVFPDESSSPADIPEVAIAEKIADILKSQWYQQ